MIRYALAGPGGFLLGIFHRDNGAPVPTVDTGNQAILVPDNLAAATDMAILQGYMARNGALVTLVPSLGMAQSAAKAQALIHFSGLFDKPAVFTYGGNPYDIDEKSQIAISGLAQAAAANIANPGSVPLPGFWIDANNNRQALTAAQYYAMASAIGNYVSGCRLRFRTIKDAILAQTTVAAVEAIDVTAGYPTASA